MKKIVSSVVTIAMVTLLSGALTAGETLAVATFSVGDVKYIRNGKKKKVAPRTVFEHRDVVITGKGKANIQVGPHAVIRLMPYSKLDFKKLYEQGDDRDIILGLKSGRVYSKIVKKLNRNSSYVIQTPSIAAGVRGTRFIVSEADESEPKHDDSDIPDGVFVDEGEVEVKGERDVVLKSGEQIRLDYEEQKKKILDDYMQQKLKILSSVDVMRERSYELLKKRREEGRKNIERIKEMNRDLIERIKQQGKIDDDEEEDEDTDEENEIEEDDKPEPPAPGE